MDSVQLSDFLRNCCRVCLSVENEMVESSNIVENFSKTIDQLLLECANLHVRYICFFWQLNAYAAQYAFLILLADPK